MITDSLSGCHRTAFIFFIYQFKDDLLALHLEVIQYFLRTVELSKK